MRTRYLGWFLAVLVAALAAGCASATSESGADTGAGGTDTATGGSGFAALYGDYLGNCKGCHAKDAPGKTSNTEQSLDLGTASTAYTSLTSGKASGLTGNAAGCNGVPFVVAGKPEQSLLLASIDSATRASFDYPPVPTCGQDSISDMTVKAGDAPSAQFVTNLKAWITAGAPNN